MDKELLIENIRRYCSAKGERPTNACINAGVGKSFISSINAGKVPSVAKVAQLAAYLGVCTSELVGDFPAENERKETGKMRVKSDELHVMKSMAYDLQKIFEQAEKDSFTLDEIKQIMDKYISDTEVL